MVTIVLASFFAVGSPWGNIAPMVLPSRRPTYKWSRLLSSANIEALRSGFLEIQWSKVILRDHKTGKRKWEYETGSTGHRQFEIQAFQFEDGIFIQWMTYYPGEPRAKTYMHLVGLEADTGKKRFYTIVAQGDNSLPRIADRKLAYTCYQYLGGIDPRNGKRIGPWFNLSHISDFYQVFPSLKGKPVLFLGGGYLDSKVLPFGSAPWGPPSAVYAWGDRYLAFYNQEYYPMEGGNGHRGIARLALGAEGKMVDEWNNRMTYAATSITDYPPSVVSSIIEVDDQGFWARRNGLVRMGKDGQPVPGYPIIKSAQKAIWTNKGIFYWSGNDMWRIRGRMVNRLGPICTMEDKLTPYGIIRTSFDGNSNLERKYRITVMPLPKRLYE